MSLGPVESWSFNAARKVILYLAFRAHLAQHSSTEEVRAGSQTKRSQHLVVGVAQGVGAFPRAKRRIRMQVKHILRDKGRDVVSISADATLSEAARLLARKRIGALVVRGSDGSLAG